MQNHSVTFEIVDQVAWITLAKPDIHNAFDDQMIADLHSIFKQLANDNNTRIVVLQSEGRSFSAGADLNWMKRMAQYSYQQNVEDAHSLAAMLYTLNTLPQLTIAKIQGATMGGAVGLVACCDVAIASNKAVFCLSEVKLGLIPAAISPYVIGAIGKRAARRYFQTAEVFDAQTALSLGLLSESVDHEQLESTITDLIHKCLKNGPQAMRADKQLIVDVADKQINTKLLEQTSRAIAEIRVSKQGQEGLLAFLEKRNANFGDQ